ncbi:aldehyde dehydrogenase family protein [Amnibacterium endophyticum]|uniref:Aldehyde dehydrogenase n=1 Tax=Amnibacterium endophyticum TaxID=2109337 RepID=A0ABW4LDC4_9MICO
MSAEQAEDLVEQRVGEVVDRLRATHRRGVTKPLAWRHAQLDALAALLLEQRDTLYAALKADLGKSADESLVTEVGLLQREVAHTRRRLRGWLRPSPAVVPLPVQPGTAATVLEPLGVTLIIAPWNYPLLLALSPLIGAIAAGDAAVVKPSELAPATSRTIADLLPRYLDARAFAVVQGDAETTSALLEQRFDLVFYTGGEHVARIVMRAAAEHLTPVVLELGGKCPVYVDESADLDVAADRIAWGKWMNAGQTCVAPDHVLATRRTAEALAPRLAAAARRMFGDDPLRNDAYCRIVSERHFDRLHGLLDPAKTASGGGADRPALRIEPTVLTRVGDADPVMQQEVFGPILPIVEVASEREAIERVADGPKPLALYVFTRRSSRRAWTTGTSSGSIGFGVPLLQLAVPGIPFGGVGASGMGAYHGRRSLTAFSHEKALLTKPTRPDTVRLLSPPFTELKRRVLARFTG